MIRKVVGASSTVTTGSTPAAAGAGAAPRSDAVDSATRGNAVPRTPATVAAGKVLYEAHCAACHGPQAQGAVKAGIAISIIEESGARQPPDLTDSQWDHGGDDGQVFRAIKRGIPSTMMAGYEGRLSDSEIWQVIHYLRSRGQRP